MRIKVNWSETFEYEKVISVDDDSGHAIITGELGEEQVLELIDADGDTTATSYERWVDDIEETDDDVTE